jgi:hypothetical protein
MQPRCMNATVTQGLCSRHTCHSKTWAADTPNDQEVPVGPHKLRAPLPLHTQLQICIAHPGKRQQLRFGATTSQPLPRNACKWPPQGSVVHWPICGPSAKLRQGSKVHQQTSNPRCPTLIPVPSTSSLPHARPILPPKRRWVEARNRVPSTRQDV